MEVLLIHFPPPDTQVGGNSGLVRHAFGPVVDSDSYMSYSGFHAARRKLFADMAAFVVFVVFLDIGG